MAKQQDRHVTNVSRSSCSLQRSELRGTHLCPRPRVPRSFQPQLSTLPASVTASVCREPAMSGRLLKRKPRKEVPSKLSMTLGRSASCLKSSPAAQTCCGAHLDQLVASHAHKNQKRIRICAQEPVGSLKMYVCAAPWHCARTLCDHANAACMLVQRSAQHPSLRQIHMEHT